MKKVKQINIKKDIKISELVGEMSGSGVMGAGSIAKAVEILKKMKRDKCKIFFGLAGAMVPGGMKNIIIDMINENYIDVLVTTGANLTHDLIEALGENHYQGQSNADDSKLNEKGIDRIYNSFMKNGVYKLLENFFEKNWDVFKDCKNISQLIEQIGMILHESSGTSILRTCYEKGVPVFCPAIADSGIGLMIWGRIAKGKKINIDAFDDMKEIIDISWTSKKSAVFYIGGGVPKNFIQQSLQFSKGANYGIQITTDRAEFGGSSGASLKEGISWGKMEKDAEFIDVICDATIALPIIWGAVKK